jgi:GNAT superfamily N-acetyltransferase
MPNDEVDALHKFGAEAKFGAYSLRDWQCMAEVATAAVVCLDEKTQALVGCGLLASYGEGGGSIAGIGQMITLPEFRGTGIGSKIFNTLLSCAEEGGSAVLLGAVTELGSPVYRKLGFEERGHSTTVTCKMEALRDRGSAFQPPSERGIAVQPCADIGRLVRLDAACFGAPRPALFDTLMSCSSYQPQALVATESGRDVGYAVLTHKGSGDRATVGPMSADSADAAAALLAQVAQISSAPEMALSVYSSRVGDELLCRLGALGAEAQLWGSKTRLPYMSKEPLVIPRRGEYLCWAGPFYG